MGFEKETYPGGNRDKIREKLESELGNMPEGLKNMISNVYGIFSVAFKKEKDEKKEKKKELEKEYNEYKTPREKKFSRLRQDRKLDEKIGNSWKDLFKNFGK